MVITKQTLKHLYDVDMEIASFFADRKIPKDNKYWAKRYIYIPRGSGYLFIPLVYDILYRMGISKEKLLYDKHIQLMETVLHYAALYEIHELSYKSHIEECKNLMLNYNIYNKNLYNDFITYIDNENKTPFKIFGLEQTALNRADAFIFSFFNLEMSEESLIKLIQYWYALVATFLLDDDITDYEEDMKNNEENALNNFGDGEEGLKKALEFFKTSYALLEEVNPVLGAELRKSYDKCIAKDYYKTILKK